MLEQNSVAGFLRLMPSEETIAQSGLKSASESGRGSCYESIDHHQNAVARAIQDHAGHGGDLESAKAAKNAQRIGRWDAGMEAMLVERCLNDGAFVLECGALHAGAGSSNKRGCGPGDCSGDCARGGGVADS